MVDGLTTTVLLRIRMADRPGALSAVTRRVAAAKGDLVGIEILERHDGWAIDELVVEVPHPELVEVMAREVAKEEDVEVHDVHPVVDTPFDPRLDAFEVAAAIAGSEDVDALYSLLCAHTWRSLRSHWVCVLDGCGTVVASAGRLPPESGIAALVDGAVEPPDDVLCMHLAGTGGALALGRTGVAFRPKERRKVAALASIADSLDRRLRQQRRLRSQRWHPAGRR